jgi:hypothetical protein
VPELLYGQERRCEEETMSTMTLEQYEQYMHDALAIKMQSLREQFASNPQTHTIQTQGKLRPYKTGWIHETIGVTRE